MKSRAVTAYLLCCIGELPVLVDLVSSITLLCNFSKAIPCISEPKTFLLDDFVSSITNNLERRDMVISIISCFSL